MVDWFQHPSFVVFTCSNKNNVIHACNLWLCCVTNFLFHHLFVDSVDDMQLAVTKAIVLLSFGCTVCTQVTIFTYYYMRLTPMKFSFEKS